MKLDQSELQQQLERVNKELNGVGISAAVYLAGELITATTGLVNNVSGVEMTPETVMHIGSITKIFNTTLVMQLVDEGVVSLDDPVTRYLPELEIADKEALAKLTVRMLLNHTSGIDGEIVPDHGYDKERVEDAIPRFATMGQIHEPGEDCSYCNTATVIAGYLCQKLTGKSWYNLVKEKIFQPLGMEHAAATPEDALLYRASVGHHLNPQTDENVRTSFPFLPLSFAPAGATLMMSATDLVTFGRAHIGDGVGPNGTRILTEASTKLMQEKTIDYQGPGFAEGFGLGWMLNGDGSYGHGGGGPGILSWLTMSKEKDFAIAILTNVEHGGLIIAELTEPYFKELDLNKFRGLGGLDEAETVPSPGSDSFIGTYSNCSMIMELMEHEDGHALRVKPTLEIYDSVKAEWTPPIPIRFVDDDVFMSAVPAGPLSAPYRLVNFENGKAGHLASAGRLFKRE